MLIPTNMPIPVTERWEIIDSTKLQCFAQCPRKFFYQYLMEWDTASLRNDLCFGGAWHEALEHLYNHGFSNFELVEAYKKFATFYRREFPDATDDLFPKKNPAKAFEALIAYTDTYAGDFAKFNVVATEQTFVTPIGEGREMVAKIDLVADTGARYCVIEHKTGSQAGRTWTDQWQLSIQVGTYLHTLQYHYGKPEESAEVIVNGAFFYKGDPKFERVSCRRNNSMMIAWLSLVNSLWTQIEQNLELLSSETTEDIVMSSFPMNPTSCTSYSGCTFRDLCVCVANPLTLAGSLPSGFSKKEWNPLTA